MSQCQNETRTYIVVRHGSNGSNQPMTPRMVLGTIQAASEAEAKQAAGERWSCYANQQFEVIDLAGRTRRADRDAAFEADAYDGSY